ARDLEEREHLLGRLRADAEPVLGAVRGDLDERGLLGRVVLADLLDHATVTLGARVRDDDTVVRRTDLAETLQTNLDGHSGGLSWFWFGRTRTRPVGTGRGRGSGHGTRRREGPGHAEYRDIVPDRTGRDQPARDPSARVRGDDL